LNIVLISGHCGGPGANSLRRIWVSCYSRVS